IPKVGLTWYGSIPLPTLTWYQFLGLNFPLPFEGRPGVIILFTLAFLALFRPILQDLRSRGGIRHVGGGFGRPRLEVSNVFTVFIIGVFSYMLYEASFWNFKARIVPTIVGILAITFATLSLLYTIFKKPEVKGTGDIGEQAMKEVAEGLH